MPDTSTDPNTGPDTSIDPNTGPDTSTDPNTGPDTSTDRFPINYIPQNDINRKHQMS